MLNRACEMLIECFENGGKVLLCGNGGSAADCAHITGELVKGFLKKRPIGEKLETAAGGAPLQLGLPAIDLTAQGAVIAAIVNDLGGECVYAQQVLAYGKPGDVIIGISTSGNAQNVLLAMKVAGELGMKRIALTGKGGGRMAQECELLVDVEETETYRVQEEHLKLYHQLCARVEGHFFTE